ncbi:MAG TPA: hypothetical protein VFP47_04540, partial [Pyrinomonadaceae bacterium]|nr:hypothetical protein [Pyrinomonadaceae bacterium]
ISKGHPYSKGLPYSLGSLGYAYAVAGKPQEARQILAELKELSDKTYISPYYPAMIHAGLGEKDQAIEFLEKLYQDHDEFLSTLKVDEPFDGLHSDPRFVDLLRRINLGS